jgi:hypothetical protein
VPRMTQMTRNDAKMTQKTFSVIGNRLLQRGLFTDDANDANFRLFKKREEKGREWEKHTPPVAKRYTRNVRCKVNTHALECREFCVIRVICVIGEQRMAVRSARNKCSFRR